MEVLFVCNGNITRSQIAKALFNRLSTNHAECAGTRVQKDNREGQTLGEVVEEAAARGVSVVVLQLMAEEQMDLSENTRKQVTAAMVEAADKVIVMADRDTLPEYMLSCEKVVFWDLLDTLEASYEFVLAVKEQIKQRVHDLVHEMG